MENNKKEGGFKSFLSVKEKEKTKKNEKEDKKYFRLRVYKKSEDNFRKIKKSIDFKDDKNMHFYELFEEAVNLLAEEYNVKL